jgi:uncharacterized protein YndB with AHSA1/START domain
MKTAAVINKQSIEIDAPASKVWDALTKPEIVKKYFFGTNMKSSLKPGSPITFTGEWEGKSYEDKGTIKEITQGRMLKYSYWSSIGGMEDIPENYADITYQLTEKDGKTKLTIIQDNIPDEEMKEHSAQNWRKVMESLKKVVEEEK